MEKKNIILSSGSWFIKDSIIDRTEQNTVIRVLAGSSTVQEMCDSSIVQEMCDSSIVQKMYNSSIVQEMYDLSIAITSLFGTINKPEKSNDAIFIDRCNRNILIRKKR